MEFLPPVVARLVADIGEFSASMGKAKTELTGFAAANQRMAAAGKIAMGALALGAAAAGYESIKLASNFDQTMELIHTQAGAAQSEVDGLKNAVLDLGPATGIGPEKLAEGLYHIESTGFRGKAALDILQASARLAAMGLADLDTVTFAMSGTMSVGMKDIRDAADATNYLNTIVGMGDMKMEKLASAIGTGILPSFKSAGLGMKDFGASLATITDNSVGADEAATRLRMTISMMSAPTGPAIKALEKIGIGQFQLANDMRQPNGLLVAVEDLKHHLEASGKTAVEQNAIVSQAFGGGRTSSAILTLLGETDRLKSKYEQLGTAESRAKQANEAWAAQQQQFKQQMHEVVAQLQEWGIKLGNFLIPKLQASFEWMKKHTEAMKIIGIVIGSIVLVAIAAYIVAMVQAAIATIAATWPILLIIAAIALIAVGIYLLVKHWGTVWAWIKHIADNVWKWLVSAWNATWAAIMSVVHWIKANIIDPIVSFFVTYLINPIKAWLSDFAAVWKFWWGFFSVIIDDFVGLWEIYWGRVVAVAKWVWENVLKPVFGFINDYGIKPVGAAMDWLWGVWKAVVDGIASAAKWVWEKVLKPVFGFINEYGIQPLWSALKWFGGEWAKIWGGIGDGLSWTWHHVIEPIIDGIGKGIQWAIDKWHELQNAPGGAGKAAAHFIGFADGGWVPGPAGAAQLAVVHGGEYVLSREMIAAGGRPNGGPASLGAGAGAASGGLPTINLTIPVQMGGQTMQTLHVALIPEAQKYKARNGTTGLS
jgi:TP901 family phage tail tape measure protein